MWKLDNKMPAQSNKDLRKKVFNMLIWSYSARQIKVHFNTSQGCVRLVNWQKKKEKFVLNE
jgi:hypothetical protein